MNEKSYWIYIICDKPYGTLYIGVTSDLPRRMYEHREGLFEGFSKKYDLKMLVYVEEYGYVFDALEREKKLKKWKRQWKIDLIQKINPKWHDLYENSQWLTKLCHSGALSLARCREGKLLNYTGE